MVQYRKVPVLPAPRPVEILLVDDRPENLTALQAILGDLPGYNLVEADSGPAALRALLQGDFCLILLDAFLPGMDGFEVCRLLKQRERTRDIPVIFLTAASIDQALLRRAYEVGAADYLIKPVSAEIVRAKVGVFVDLARKTAQLKEQAELLQETERREQAVRLAELTLASERRYRHLAESIPQIVWRSLPDGNIEYWNHRWYDYTGSAPGMTGEDARAYLHPEERERCLALWSEAVESGQPYQTECRILRADGTWRWHLRRALPERGPSGEIVAWLGTDTDIDDRKRADDERIELLVRERAARFEAEAAQKRAARLYIEAREAVRVRDDFLTVAAHELRTPLTTLRLLAQQLVRGAQAGETSRTVLRSVDRLVKLVDQLLDVSRIAGGRAQLQVERADLRAVVQEAAARLGEEAGRSGCTISVHEDGPVLAEFDPLRIEQVVANLLTNAIKYGRGKPIELSLERGKHHVRLLVRDQGIGVATEEQGRIFERFARAVSVREYGGLGLGLFISKQIVEAHGGSIRVASTPGSGATFLVELPVEHTPQRSQGAEAH
jgi:PAS domain S-box-containing protein